MSKTDPCPCGSGQPYGDCCNVFLGGKRVPATAEQLMRSRYTAFALEKAAYLVATRDPDRRAADELAGVKKSFRGLRWTGLEIVAAEAGGPNDAEGWVEFIAHYRQGTRTGRLHERSRFRRDQGQWFYVDGELYPDGEDR